MQVDEEDQTTDENGTAANTNDEGNPRKKARKARKQLQREKQGNKQEQEAKKTATSAATGATVSPVFFSFPVGARKTSTQFSPRQITFEDHKHLHTQEFTTASCVLSQKEKYSEFTIKIRTLMTEGQKIEIFFN